MSWPAGRGPGLYEQIVVAAMVSHSQPLSKRLRRNAINAKTGPKIACFWPLHKMSMGQVCYKLPNIYN